MKPTVYALMLAAFVIGTVELIIGGILGLMAYDLDVSVSAVGQLISVYSLIFAVSAPVLLTVTQNTERKKLYLVMLSVFAAAVLLSAVSPNYIILMISRIVLAASTSLITVLSVTIAANIVSETFRGKAIGMVNMGISGSLVLGVPIGIIIGQAFGWRTIFMVVFCLTLVAMIGIYTTLPEVKAKPPVPFIRQIASLKNTKIFGAHLANVFMLAGHLTLYAYLAPFLQSELKLDENWLSIFFFIFGIAAIAGGGLGGWATDKWPVRRLLPLTLSAFVVVLAILPVVTGSMTVFIPIFVVWSMLSWGNNPVLQRYLMNAAPETSDIQLGFNLSTSHIGIALGSGIGGLVIEKYPIMYNAWVGAFIVLLALICVLFSITRSSTHMETSQLTIKQQDEQEISLHDKK